MHIFKDRALSGHIAFRSLYLSLILCFAVFLNIGSFGQFAKAANINGSDDNARSNQGLSAAQTQSALEEVQRNLKVSDKRRAELAAEVKTIRKDSKKLNELITQTAKAERNYTQDIAARTVRLQNLQKRRQAQQEVLDTHHREMAEILAGLEKMGVSPPPAVLVHADDAVQSLYSSVLMGALLPQIQEKTKLIQTELDKLIALENSIKQERAKLNKSREKQVDERMRLALLLEEKERQENQTQKNIQEEEHNRRILAEKAQSLQDLLDEVAKKTGSGANGAPTANQIHIANKLSTQKGKLQRPVVGEKNIYFGQKKDNKSAQGEQYETAPGATVLAPAEGEVRYADEFRSYGQVVILDAGENYYFVLAGMAHINVSQGQFLLQGEPMGTMESLLIADDDNLKMSKIAPKLYIEMRKNGRPINPDPWWAPDQKNQ